MVTRHGRLARSRTRVALRARGAVMAITAVLAAGAVLSAVALASPHSTTVFLVSTKGVDMTRGQCVAMGGCGPSVTAPVVLLPGHVYTVRVTGTIAVWNFWPSTFCGHALPRPLYPTPGPVVMTSDDAVFRFAVHSSAHCPHLPWRTGLFQINTGSGWFVPTAVGNPQQPTGGAEHPYKFLIRGQGVAPQFRFVDYIVTDNHGSFRIVISGDTTSPS